MKMPKEVWIPLKKIKTYKRSLEKSSRAKKVSTVPYFKLVTVVLL